MQYIQTYIYVYILSYHVISYHVISSRIMPIISYHIILYIISCQSYHSILYHIKYHIQIHSHITYNLAVPCFVSSQHHFPKRRTSVDTVLPLDSKVRFMRFQLLPVPLLRVLPAKLGNPQLNAGRCDGRSSNVDIFPHVKHRGVPLVILLVRYQWLLIHFSHCSNHIMTRDANGYPLVSWNQTWIAGKSSINGGLMRKSLNSKWWIFHCNVWLPEGIYMDLSCKKVEYTGYMS